MCHALRCLNRGLFRRLEIFVFLATFGVLLFPAFAVAEETDELTAKLEEIRQDHGVPALAAVAMRHGKLVANAAAGVRKLGAPDLVTSDDQWHLGSISKSMTATLAGMMVDEGKLHWHSTIAEVFPELEDAMQPAWRAVTLEQLLTHRSGAPEHPPVDLWAEALKQSGTPTEQRLAIVHGTVCRPPQEPPGKKFLYSNEGYAIAGAMMERVTGRAWEDLLRERLFKPLEMKSAGFGAPASPGKPDQPWGHFGALGELRPVTPGPMADNPPAIGPAGSNAMFYAVMWVAPEKDAVFVAATNAAHSEADDACNEAVVALMRRVLGKN